MVFRQMIAVESGLVRGFDQFEARLVQLADRIWAAIKPVEHAECDFC